MGLLFLFALLFWGVVTFMAVRLAILSANRATVRPAN
jgi:hypothetical protein